MTEYLILIIQLNLAILDEFIDNKSPFYDYLLNIDHFLWQGLIGGAIRSLETIYFGLFSACRFSVILHINFLTYDSMPTKCQDR